MSKVLDVAEDESSFLVHRLADFRGCAADFRGCAAGFRGCAAGFRCAQRAGPW